MSGHVKVTALGSHDGEFCPLDRALIFEDPYGTRILYDVGRTVRGPDDPRLGRIDSVLLSHVHGDHLGDLISATPNAGVCGKPAFAVKATPNSNTANVAAGKKAAIVVGSDNDLVRPNAVIPSHANEGATSGGKVIAGTRTEAFMKAARVPVHVPLSGRTMSFEGNARCVAGC